MADPVVELTSWTGPWPDDDPDANFKADVALYARADPLRTVTGLAAATGIPVGAVVRYVLARWASEGASGLLELGPTMTRRLQSVCGDAEIADTDEARLAAYHQLRQMIGWLNYPLDHPEVYDEPIDRIRQARAIGSVAEARELYDRWAVSYDHDVYAALGFTGAEQVAARIGALVGSGAEILDAGCGTGAVGERLVVRGFSLVDGIDLSPKMLKVAHHKGVYRHLDVADLNAALRLDRRYDVVVSAGTFVTGHVGSEALTWLVGVLRPAGVFVATVMEAFWETGGFPKVVAALEAAGEVEVVSCEAVTVSADGGSTARLLTLRRREAADC